MGCVFLNDCRNAAIWYTVLIQTQKNSHWKKLSRKVQAIARLNRRFLHRVLVRNMS